MGVGRRTVVERGDVVNFHGDSDQRGLGSSRQVPKCRRSRASSIYTAATQCLFLAIGLGKQPVQERGPAWSRQHTCCVT